MIVQTLLKRYTNRRLYDTRLSRYITLEEMAHRIRKGEDFEVRDAQTEEDLTRKVLMQIIVLESLEIAELLPMEFLTLLIRIRERGVQELFVRYLRVSMEAFTIAQRQLEDNVRLVHHQVSLTANLVRHLLPFAARHGEPSPAQAAEPTPPLSRETSEPPDGAEPASEPLPVEEELLFAARGARGPRRAPPRRRR